MKCPFSVPLKNKYDIMGRPVYRPCGECAICRRNKLMLIQSRANYEFLKHKYCAFVTLTYDDNHLPYNFTPFGDNVRVGLPSIKKHHIVKFFDDLRHYVKYHSNLKNVDKDFSYIYSCEYGGQFDRPHAHLVLFGIDFPIAKKICSKVWKFGFVDVRPVSSGTVRYICKYINKGAKGKFADAQYFDKGVEKPFVKWSKGFGSGLYRDNFDNIKRNGFIAKGNKRIFVPPYYKNKIINNNIPNLMRQEINRQFDYYDKFALAKHFGFNSVDEFEKKMALNTISNELYKNINNRSSVSLAEVQGAR